MEERMLAEEYEDEYTDDVYEDECYEEETSALDGQIHLQMTQRITQKKQ